MEMSNATQFPSFRKHVEELIRLKAPQNLLEDEDALDYLCSLFTSEDSPREEADIAIIISQFFGADSGRSSEQFTDDVDILAGQIRSLLVAQTTREKMIGDEIVPVGLVAPLVTPSRFMEGTVDDSKVCENEPKSQAETRKNKKQKERKFSKAKRKGARGNNINDADTEAETDEGLGALPAAAVEAISAKDLEDLDDHSSAWSRLKEEGKGWGGRGCGGRGLRGNSSTASNIHLSGVSLLFSGNELLQNATIQISGGHRYGLIGRNGVGKTTLLRRLARKNIPGFPLDVRVMLVKQQVDGGPDSALEVLLKADEERSSLLEEQAELEKKIDCYTDNGSAGDSQSLDEIVERLGVVVGELEAIDADRAEERAREILKGLQFTDEMMTGPTSNLSGGWRMRVAIAKALYVPSDLLLLDEPTNHLDFQALLWLQDHLASATSAVIIVSHDRAFLDGVCTDIMHFEHKKLKYHVGNFSSYEQQREEAAARHSQILDATERQRAKAVSFIEQQKKASADPKKQRQAKMMKETKLERIGNYREDGKRYKTRSLRKLGEEYLRTAEKVVVEADEPVIKLRFTDPTWPPGMTTGIPLVKTESLDFAYTRGGQVILRDITIDIARERKVAVVGRNGAGKTTLLKIITGNLSPLNGSLSFTGKLWRHPCLRIGHVTQHHVEEMDNFASTTVLQYAERILLSGTACLDVTKNAAGNVRQYLGGFGLGGKHANRPIGTLSGGERMRLCFCSVMAQQPHLLMLDEPTNHCDMETLDALSLALNKFQGAVVVISHNQGFLSGFCNELWIVEEGKVDVRYSDTQSFDEIFLQYRAEVTAGANTRSSTRDNRSRMAKKAQKQRMGTIGSSGFVS